MPLRLYLGAPVLLTAGHRIPLTTTTSVDDVGLAHHVVFRVPVSHPGCGEVVGERRVSATVRRCMGRRGLRIASSVGFRHRRSPRADSANGGRFFIQSLDALTCKDRKSYISS